MTAILVIFFVAWFSMALQAETLAVAQMANDLREINQSTAAKRVADRLQAHYRTTGSLPGDLDTFLAQPEQAAIRNLANPWMGYATSNTLDDGYWQFQRAVLFQQVPDEGLPETDFLAAANNHCGTQPFVSAIDWCYHGSAFVWQFDSRLTHINRMLETREKLRLTMRKLGLSYSAHQKFPDSDGSGGTLTGTSATSLVAMIGYGGSHDACQGTFTAEWAGEPGAAPLDCQDLFSAEGMPVEYNYFDPKHVSVVTRTRFLRSGGDPVLIGDHINLNR